ncbi:hypothetical protein HQ585_17085 [candidate division KSB1 bacterium]|nr:hypothetical protein [candidate division KSB1 bacterium]
MFRYLFNSKRIAIIALIITVITSVIIATSTAGSGEDMSEINKAANSQRYVFIIYILSLAITVIMSVMVWKTSNKYQDAVKADADARIEEAKLDILKMKEKVANAQRKQSEAELKLAAIAKKQEWRRLPLEIFLSSLKSKQTASAEILYPENDAEAYSLASELYMGLLASGWEVTQPQIITLELTRGALRDTANELAQKIPLVMLAGVNINGISVLAQYPPNRNADTPAGNILDALLKCQFPISSTHDEALPADIVRIVVGTKP